MWTWAAIDADTKLVPSWLVGERTNADAYAFLSDLKSRLKGRVQLTTDGHKPYLTVIEPLFGADGVDFATLIKMYGNEPGNDHRYSPGVCTGIEKRVTGTPDEARISTSYVERQNLTMRMGMRRSTRLTNGFSKKVENLAFAVSLHYIHYNFCRPHATLTKRCGKPTTAAMAAGWRSTRGRCTNSSACSTRPSQTDPLPKPAAGPQRRSLGEWTFSRFTRVFGLR